MGSNICCDSVNRSINKLFKQRKRFTSALHLIVNARFSYGEYFRNRYCYFAKTAIYIFLERLIQCRKEKPTRLKIIMHKYTN